MNNLQRAQEILKGLVLVCDDSHNPSEGMMSLGADTRKLHREAVKIGRLFVAHAEENPGASLAECAFEALKAMQNKISNDAHVSMYTGVELFNNLCGWALTPDFNEYMDGSDFVREWYKRTSAKVEALQCCRELPELLAVAEKRKWFAKRVWETVSKEGVNDAGELQIIIMQIRESLPVAAIDAGQLAELNYGTFEGERTW